MIDTHFTSLHNQHEKDVEKVFGPLGLYVGGAVVVLVLSVVGVATLNHFAG